MMKSLHRHLLVAGLVGSLGLAAVAQTAPAAPAGGPQQQQQVVRGEHGRMDPQRAEQFRARHEQRQAQQLAELKAQLRITPAQESAWGSWTGAMKPQAVGQRKRIDRTEWAALTTPQRIDRMRQLRAERTAAMDQRGEATKAFYGALTQEQQRVFDAVGSRYARGGMGGGKHRHGMRHHFRG